MRTELAMALFVAAALPILSASPATNLTGTWTGEIKGQDGGTGQVRVVLRQDGGTISGTAGPIDKQNPGRIYDANLEGEHLTFAADDADETTGLKLTYHFDITVTGDRMQGTAHGRSGDRSWTLDINLAREK